MQKEKFLILPLGEDKLKRVYNFMRPIWHETYAFLPPKQVDLLLEKYFAYENILRFIEKGYEYYDINGVGVLTVQERKEGLYIDKLYLLPCARGKNYPQKVFEFLSKRKMNMILNVNEKNERAIKCYLKNGFKIIKEEKIELGDGLVNCDYVMEKEVE